MELINTTDFFADCVNQFNFLIGVALTIIFYVEYKKCAVAIENEEMLDQFLND